VRTRRTFVLERNEPSGLSTAAGPAGTITLDLRLARRSGRASGNETSWAAPGRPGDGLEFLYVHHPHAHERPVPPPAAYLPQAHQQDAHTQSSYKSNQGSFYLSSQEELLQ
jgi:hypothetical protein